MALLELSGFSLRIGDALVLDNLRLSIDAGERLAVIGVSGSGKSALARALLGFLPPNAVVSGEYRFSGTAFPPDGSGRAEVRGRYIGFVPQHAEMALDPLQPVGGQIGEALRIGARAGDHGVLTAELLISIGLDAADALRLPGELAAHQRRLAVIVMALATRPKLLIADEPLAGLDPVAQRRVIDLIEQQGTAVLLISSDLKAVAALCSRVAVLKAGTLVEVGDTQQILGRPAHRHTRTLVTAGRHRAKTLMRPTVGAPLLEVRGVARRYRQPDRSMFEPQPPLTALHDVSFTIREGEAVAVAGRSGSGKSTLARIVAGLESASDGELVFAGTSYRGSDMPRLLRHQISFVFRDPRGSFDPAIPVGESLAEPLKLEPLRDVDELGERMAEMVDAVGLPTRVLDRMPETFNAGELQRLALARALITRPRLVVLDDPLSTLDLASRGDLTTLLGRIRADFGLSLLITTNDLQVVPSLADRLFVLHEGTIVENGTPAQLFDRPQHIATAELVAAALPEVEIVPLF